MEEKLTQAVKSANIELVKDILIHHPAMADVRENGVWLVMLAAKTGNPELLRYIVEYSRANLNVVDSKNRSVLFYGVESGNLEVVKYLTERVGLSFLQGDFDLLTCYELAKNLGFSQIEKYFESRCGFALEEAYKNPIRHGMFPDPSIVRVGDDYYMVNSSFIYFPCIPVSHSRDLVNWKIIGYAITNPEWAALDGLEGGRGYWAPDISYHNGEFYITATYRLNDDKTVYRRQIVVHSPKPEGPYSRPAIIDEDGIDPSLFWEDDRCYMLLNRGARILPLDSTASKQTGPATLLYYGSNKRASEGPHLLKKDGYYYLFEAEGGTGIGHMETVSRATSLMGVYEPCPYNPILRQKDDGAGIRRCGHGKPVSTPDGRWYMVYLCGRMIYDEEFGMTVLGRETCLDEITWTADGWPIVNNLNGPSNIAAMPVKGTKQAKNPEFTDDFEGTAIKKEWVFPRPPQDNATICKNGVLKLLSSPADLSEINARNIMLIRQTAFDFEAGVTVRLLSSSRQAGITCYYDENSFLNFYIEDGHLKLRQHVGRDDILQEMLNLDGAAGDIHLKTVCHGLTREFYYRTGCDVEYKLAFRLPKVTYLCDEGVKMGKRFTGAMTGLFAYADNDSFYGEFSNFYYKELV